MHQQIAQLLEDDFPDLVETQPELVAYHHTEAGYMEQAVAYWQRAGQRAAERSAHPKAIAHLRKGVAGLVFLPDTPNRIDLELTLQVTLGESLRAVQGYGAPEVERVFTRAKELCQQVGDTPQSHVSSMLSSHTVEIEEISSQSERVPPCPRKRLGPPAAGMVGLLL